MISSHAERLDLLHLLVGQIAFGDALEPFLGDLDLLLAVVRLDALEDLVEDLVEAVEQPSSFT
jgi:hypothetical protein